MRFNNSAGLQDSITLLAASKAGSLSFVNTAGANAYTFDTAATENNNTLTITSGITNADAAGITFYNATTLAANQTWTSSGGTMAFNGNVNLGSGATGYTLTVAGADAVNIAGIVANGGTAAGSLTKTGAGTLTLSGANTYTGTTTVSAGILNMQNSGALGTASNTANTTVASGAVLQIGNNITTTNAGTLTLNGTGTGSGALENLSGNNAWGSDVTLGSNATIFSSTAGNTLTIGNAAYTSLFTMGAHTVTIDGPGNTLFNSNVGVVGDTGGLIKNGTGTLTFYGYDTYYTGATAINAGALDIWVGPDASGWYGINGSLTIGTGPANPALAGSVSVNIFSNTVANQISPTSAVTINSDGALNVASSTSLGTLTLNGGQLNISSGVTVNPTGNLTSNANSAHETSLISGGALDLTTGNISVARDATLASDLTISSAIGGTNITKTGNGILSLSGANTYTGTTTIAAGVIAASTSNTVLGTGAVTVDSGATLQINSGLTLANAMTLNGAGAVNGAIDSNPGAGNTVTLNGGVTLGSSATISSDTGTLTVAGAVGLGANSLNVSGTGSTALNGAITGTAASSLSKNGSGTLSLGAANPAFLGSVAINAGTLQFNINSALAGNALAIGAAGTLNLNGTSQSVGTFAGGGALNMGASGSFTLLGSSTLNGTLTGTGTIVLGAGSTLTLGANFNDAGINITLAGGELKLNGTSDTFGNLSITSNSIIDFGNPSASILDVNSVALAGGTTLTIKNWANLVDYFYSNTNPGLGVSQIAFTGYAGPTKWNTYTDGPDNFHQITPAPEPATYGAIFTGLALFGIVIVRRRKATRSQGTLFSARTMQLEPYLGSKSGSIFYCIAVGERA